MTIKPILPFLLCLLVSPLAGQQIDSEQVFSLDSFLVWVRTNHPVMRQAALLDGKASATLLEAKGAFDPKLYGDYEDKSFDQKNYFRYGEAGLKVPTWFGADVKLAYAWANGEFLNPASKLPANGQAIVGVEVPLAQGLLFDQRRAQVEQARLYREGNEAERQNITNDLLLTAIETYWQWAYQYEILKIYENALQLAQNRLNLITVSFEQGDKPAIDTLESLIQVQNRQLNLQQATVDYQNATLHLSNFLWGERLEPLEITPQLKPEQLNVTLPIDAFAIANTFRNNLNEVHPTLLALQIKQQQLEVKERLKKEALKPDLRLNYNFLGTGLDFSAPESSGTDWGGLFTENYKWGIELNYPLFLRKARGGLELVRLEQTGTRYKFSQKQLEIQNKITTIAQQLANTQEQLNIQSDILVNYTTLLSAENEKFRIGESSIFLINSREQKLIETQLKVAKLQANFQKLQGKLQWAGGRLR